MNFAVIHEHTCIDRNQTQLTLQAQVSSEMEQLQGNTVGHTVPVHSTFISFLNR